MKNMKLYGVALLLALGVSFGATQFLTIHQTQEIAVTQSGPWHVSSPFDIGIQTAYADSAPVPVVATPVASPTGAGVPVSVAPKLPAPPTDKITWVQSIVDFLASTPWGGKILAILFSILAIVTVVATALASVLLAVSKALDAMGKSFPWMATVSDWIDAVNKWVMYVSIYNVQKNPPAGQTKQA